MFDLFYIGKKSGLFAHEKVADCIEHARSLGRTRYLWIADAHNDYSGFDWLWEPTPWQSHQAHVWPSQHQTNGGTWLIPKQGYQDINRDHPVISRSQSVPRLHIKHMSQSPDQGQVNTRFISDYLGTMRRSLAARDWTYCWVTADVCDYRDFDFTWHPSEWQDHMLHVFSSHTYDRSTKFGDTFFLHVPTFLTKSQNLELLEWFDTLNFVSDISVPRRPIPQVWYKHDNLVDEIWQHDFQAPVVQFFRHWPAVPRNIPAINLWRKETRAVIPLNAGASTVIVPRDVKNSLSRQVYDYAVIDKTHACEPEPVLDVVFISNGEPGAEHHLDILTKTLRAANAKNKLHRVSDIQGRVACYQAAARCSETDWFFAVFAKLQVNEDFDWQWQPDRLQAPKHYIFHAYNPVNHLIYGHQAMIAYNRRLVLANTGQGLDFTLNDTHEVVPIMSGTTYYDNDPWTCWRTAFRECIKLQHSLPDVENDYRLQQWLSVGEGVNGHWSTTGANDAVKYYESVGGNFDQIKKSYEWAWLASYAMMIHPELFTQSKT